MRYHIMKRCLLLQLIFWGEMDMIQRISKNSLSSILKPKMLLLKQKLPRLHLVKYLMNFLTQFRFLQPSVTLAGVDAYDRVEDDEEHICDMLLLNTQSCLQMKCLEY